MVVPAFVSVLPFVAMLLAIAVLPAVVPHWWEPNRNKGLVALLLSVPVLVLYGPAHPVALLDAARDYLSFVFLLAALFVISSGVALRGNLRATPLVNTGFLALGALLASFVGTTGASMLLIRPLLQSNRERTRVRHTVVFFIFLVSNVGGMLTPLGDPPLFLGFLAGVPFAWTFRLWPIWATMAGALLAVFFVYDSILISREPAAAVERDRRHTEPVRVLGTLNVVWLGGVTAAVILLDAPWRELAIISCTGASLLTTDAAIRRQNRFAAKPMIEVAVIFAGIFLTMVPAVELLRLHGASLGVRAPWQFFWATGLLSSVLDNAPTYLTFLALAQGLGLSPEVAGIPHALLAAISVGAVAMGANTYIGNAPNFMVKAIAEHHGVRMPSFFGYLAFSGTILVPLFVLITLFFFR